MPSTLPPPPHFLDARICRSHKGSKEWKRTAAASSWQYIFFLCENNQRIIGCRKILNQSVPHAAALKPETALWWIVGGWSHYETREMLAEKALLYTSASTTEPLPLCDKSISIRGFERKEPPPPNSLFLLKKKRIYSIHLRWLPTPPTPPLPPPLPPLRAGSHGGAGGCRGDVSAVGV